MNTTMQLNADAAPMSGPTKREAASVMTRVGIGNALEWYDWTAYAIFSPFFASKFFDSSDPTTSLLATLAIFGVGFFMRPIGGIFFGWLADRSGRRLSLTTAILCTGLGSLLIGISPTFESVGVWAAVILLFARLVQGLGHGGEVVSSYTYLAEMAPARHRGMWASTVYIFVTIGVLAAILLGAVMTSWLGEEAVKSWGWRVPFIIGGLIGFYAIYMRRTLDETEVFKNARKDMAEPAQASRRVSTLQGLREHKVSVLRVFGVAAGSTVFYYVWAVLAPSFAIRVKGIDAQSALWASVVANLVFIAVLMPIGILSDKIGRKPLMIAFAVCAMLFSFPLDWLIQDQAWQLVLAMSGGLIIIGLLAAPMPAYYAELFPTEVRGIALGLPYSIANAIVGGTAPFLQVWLTTRGYGDWFTWYVIGLSGIVLLTMIWSPETKGKKFY